MNGLIFKNAPIGYKSKTLRKAVFAHNQQQLTAPRTTTRTTDTNGVAATT
jgi:hypothetical protein